MNLFCFLEKTIFRNYRPINTFNYIALLKMGYKWYFLFSCGHSFFFFFIGKVLLAIVIYRVVRSITFEGVICVDTLGVCYC